MGNVIKDDKTRKWLYHVAAALFAVLGAYGVVTPENAESWLLLAGAVLGVGSTELAAVNTRQAPEAELE